MIEKVYSLFDKIHVGISFLIAFALALFGAIVLLWCVYQIMLPLINIISGNPPHYQEQNYDMMYSYLD